MRQSSGVSEGISASKRAHQTIKEPVLIDVVMRLPQRDCPIYSWDNEHSNLRLVEIYHAQPGLPADVAAYTVEATLQLTVLLLSSLSVSPGTRVQARMLGAFSPAPNGATSDASFMDGWVIVAAAQVDTAYASFDSMQALPPAQVAQFMEYVQMQAPNSYQQSNMIIHDAEDVMRVLREARVAIKRQQRALSRGKARPGDEIEEKPVAWRAIEGLSEALRRELKRNTLLAQGEDAPHAQAEQLIRFVPQRFQHTLERLLLDDERLLAFIERPLLRHRAGLLGSQTWRSNQGLFVLTDRQALWLRDFLTPGKSLLEGGYIARVAPLERLLSIALLPPGVAPGEFADRLGAKDSPYQRLLLEVECAPGSELFTIEFPANAEVEKALVNITGMLRAFLPQASGEADRRLRRLPEVEMWLPQGTEAERLAGLGGIVAPPIARFLTQQLASIIQETGEEALVTALIPPLEEHKAPARLVALTRRAVLVIDERKHGPRAAGEKRGELQEHHAGAQISRYELNAITTAQLRYSLLGSGLSLFVPGQRGEAQQISLPFNSPAIAWFLPLFTRLRLLLSEPYR
jgi:hypothetical protein